jgi:transketolase N-terminal domain/subunit
MYSEAARSATALKLDNLIVIVDRNGKQLSRETAYSEGETALVGSLESLWLGGFLKYRW